MPPTRSTPRTSAQIDASAIFELRLRRRQTPRPCGSRVSGRGQRGAIELSIRRYRQRSRAAPRSRGSCNPGGRRPASRATRRRTAVLRGCSTNSRPARLARHIFTQRDRTRRQTGRRDSTASISPSSMRKPRNLICYPAGQGSGFRRWEGAAPDRRSGRAAGSAPNGSAMNFSAVRPACRK